MICFVARSYSKNRERNATPAKNSQPLRVLTVRPRPGDPRLGLLRAGAMTFRCALGRSGISANKREGDGATPLATMRVLGGYFRRSRFPIRSALQLGAITPDLGWCDLPTDRNYNRPVRLPYRASHEEMLRGDGLYDAVIVLDWNITPRRRGRGSAIFLHLARPGFQPTEGCVAVSRRTMAWLLPRLSARTVLKVAR